MNGKAGCLSLVLMSLLAPSAGAESVTEAAPGNAVERHLPSDQALTPWVTDPDLLTRDAGDTVEVRPVTVEQLETVKLQNVIPPIRFPSGVADIPPSYVDTLRETLETLQDRRNVRLHLIGHADTQRLSESLARMYGDNAGLSRERAGEVAEFLQRRLALPPEAIAYEWAGDTRPVASNATEAGRALNRRVEVEVWYDVAKARATTQEVLVKEDFRRLKVCRTQTVCRMSFREGHARRTRVRNLVPPLAVDEDSTTIPPAFLTQVRRAFENLGNKQNVVVKFIGYTDDQPLTGRNERIYGNHEALSKARAHRVALAVQEALGLPSASLASDGRGATRPMATNATPQGRALNRRVEVEYWHDDPLEELPEEPQLCPDETGAETVTRVYDPPWGPIDPLALDGGQPVVPAGYTDALRRAMDEIKGRRNVRLRFVGYTRNEHLDRRTAGVYGDDIGLSAARARRAMELISTDMQLAAGQAEHEGRGFVTADDVVTEGFVQGETSEIVVQVVYDELAIADDYEGVNITPLKRELRPENPFGLNLMRITVDGEPLDDKGRSSADIQRCTDVAFEQADIRFQFDSLRSDRRLSVTAAPTTVTLQELDTSAPPDEELPAIAAMAYEHTPEDDEPASPTSAPESLPRFAGAPVRFRMYTNYTAFIHRAEIRIFEPGQSGRTEPLAIVPVDPDGFAEWEPAADQVRAPLRELGYLLRAYDDNGRFDETSPQSLWLVREVADDPGTVPAQPAADATGAAELLAGYGENDLAVDNIALGSGTVQVRGSGIPAGHTVWVAGRPVPVAGDGSFVAEEILPSGMHTVEVAVLDAAGNGSMYLRDLEFRENDWFYVGVADLTASQNRTSGPADLLQGENSATDLDSNLDGRLAFFVKGNFDERWGITASADTREGPVGDLFSNFLDKSPESLFRRIDPDYHFPTFGDDAVVEELAPTMGKFYVRLNREEDYALWGNFKVSYLENELAHVDRGLYGATAHYQSDTTTRFGEERLGLDAFAAEPGTIGGREEFRGTGGSLYFLKNQDILMGSERVRIEFRDKDSGLVTAVRNLQPVVDYDIDYLQGRVMLTEPLSATARDELLVRSDGLSGDDAVLVVRYEYTPGFGELDAIATGGQGHYWLNDHVRLGLTTSNSDEGAADASLNGADLVLQMSAESWVKVQAARSKGLVSQSAYSDDGGFGFIGYDDAGFDHASAGSYRVDLSMGLNEVRENLPGRLTLYTQSTGAGFSAPGQSTLTDTSHFGGTFALPVRDNLQLRAKADRREQDAGLETDARELDLEYRITERWSTSGGVRMDTREYRGLLVPAEIEQGDRTDAVFQVGYDSQRTWRAYGFAQETLSNSEGREENGRLGTGGLWRLSESVSADAEVSAGDLGPGARVGTNVLVSERTRLYLNYALENERTDNGVRGRHGNLVTGVKRRLSDSSSMYFEERYQHTDSLSGLTHATGMNLAPDGRWNLGLNTEIGTLVDDFTGNETDRQAGGIRVGYGVEKVQVSSAIEYRLDEIQQLTLDTSERTTWLFRNSIKVQLTPDWRLIGKFNHADSESSLGQFHDGGYTEAVLGYAYRPISNDRLNALAKYTFFFNVPTTDQVTRQATAAEFIQRSHVAALDLSYDLTSRWSLGGKYAYRLGEVSLDREDREFFDNRAHLYIIRTDFRFLGNWEASVEARTLDLTDLNQQRTGALLAIYRSLGQHVKLGVGYNFTDFADDLTDLSYDHQGAFVNVVGAM